MNVKMCCKMCSPLRHREDNETFRSNFISDVDSVHNAIPFNPFEVDDLCLLSNRNPFPANIIEHLKQLLSVGGCSDP